MHVRVSVMDLERTPWLTCTKHTVPQRESPFCSYTQMLTADVVSCHRSTSPTFNQHHRPCNLKYDLCLPISTYHRITIKVGKLPLMYTTFDSGQQQSVEEKTRINSDWFCPSFWCDNIKKKVEKQVFLWEKTVMVFKQPEFLPRLQSLITLGHVTKLAVITH